MTSAAKCYSAAAAGLTTVVYINNPNSARDGVGFAIGAPVALVWDAQAALLLGE